MMSLPVRLVVAAVLGVAFASSARGQIQENRFLTIDFTKSTDAAKLVSWSDKKLNLTATGLGFDGQRNQSRDVRIELKEPMAVGWSWQPATTVMVRAEVKPPGEFRFGANSITYPSTAGVLYARYSPDAKHWSTWQPMQLREPRRKDQPRLVFHGQLRTPQKVREPYIAYLNQFSGKKRYLGDVDEEAAVRALLKEDPDYFARRLPFIGYVDFLWETQIRGHQRLKSLTLELSYWGSGRGPTPKGHREREPWRIHKKRAD